MRWRNGLAISGVVGFAILGAAVAAQSGPDAVARYRDANGARILRDFATLLSLPNRARDTADIERNATYIRDQLVAAGVKSELLRVDGAPLRFVAPQLALLFLAVFFAFRLACRSTFAARRDALAPQKAVPWRAGPYSNSTCTE